MTALAPNQPQTIIRKKPNHAVPREFLETALRRCPTASGFAVQDITDGVKSLETDEFDRAITLENLMTLNEKTTPYEAVFWIANLTGKWDKADIQPFTITVRAGDAKPEDKGTCVLSFFVEGDFPNFNDNKDHTEEYNFAHEIIIPMIEEMFEAADGDIGKFIAKLHSPLFKKNLMAHVGHRGVFVFLPLEGDPIAFGQNELGGEYDWGEVSQNHDFGKEKAQSPITKAVEAVGKAAGKFSIFKKSEPRLDADGKPLPDGVHATPEPKPAAPHPDAPKPVGKPEDIPIPKTDAMRTKVEIMVPSQLVGDSRNAWIRLFSEDGELPKNHQSKNLKLWVYPEQLPFVEEKVSTKQEVKALGARMKEALSLQPRPSGPIDMKAAHKEIEKVTEPTARSPSDFIPDMDDKEMMEQTTILASFVDRDKVPSAIDIQKLEADWPTYSEKLGIPFGDLLRYTVADFMRITHGDKPSVMVILEFRRKLMEMVSAEKLKDLIGAAVVKKETAKHVTAKAILAPDPKTTSTPLQAAAPKRNILGLKRTA